MAAFMPIRAVKRYGEGNNVLNFNNYKSLHRFSEENVEYLTNVFLTPNVGDEIETRGGALFPKKQMEIFLRFLACPNFQIGIAEECGVHRTTVCKTVSNVLDIVFNKADEWIIFPVTDAEKTTAKQLWQTKFQFPHAFCAIDCTHVQIQKPTEFADEYINRKGLTTINVQVTCDAREMITSVEARFPGSTHDSRILRRSALHQHMTNLAENHFNKPIILADSGYPLLPWLMTPFKEYPNRNLTEEERNYNTIHKSVICHIL